MEIVNFLVTGIARTGEVELPVIADATGPARVASLRDVWFDAGWMATPVYDRGELRQGHAIDGPALVEENASVTVLVPGMSLVVDRHGHLLISA